MKKQKLSTLEIILLILAALCFLASAANDAEGIHRCTEVGLPISECGY